MEGARLVTDSYRLVLRSTHWVEHDGVFYWSSLGPSNETPSEALEDGRLESIEDDWAAIRIEDGQLTLLADLVRSHALFYARHDERWVVSDSPEAMRELLPEWRLDPAAEVFELTGFTLNERTLIDGVSVVEAASRVSLPFGSERADIQFWGVPLYGSKGIEDPEEFSRLYDRAVRGAFSTLLERTDGRQLVLPLSGGLDSRLIALLLRELGAPNVLTFTYGRLGSQEAEIARKVASELDLDFVFVPMEPAEVRALWFSEESDGFQDGTWSASALPHVQDWFALRWLHASGVVEPDAVFLPGHTPVGMMHHLEILESPAGVREIAGALAEHHALNKDERGKLAETAEFRRAVRRTLEAVPPGPRHTQNTLEWFNYRERQAKYINNSMKAYEFFGWDWALPLYWPEVLAVWLSGSEALTADRVWYQRFIETMFAKVTGQPSELGYFLPPAESSRVPFREQIVSFSRKTGLNRLATRFWEWKVQRRHPLALEGFVGENSEVRLASLLARDRNLMRIWARTFLANRWGSGLAERVPQDARPPDSLRKPRLLIVSYSDIERDARLRKQIDLFLPDYAVTVVGHGHPFETGAELILFPSAETRWKDRLRAALLHTRIYWLAQRLEADNVVARGLLRGREFDAVLTNDIEPVGTAVDLFGAEKVHSDLHEYYPGLQDQDPAWVRLRQPYYEWMLQRHVAQVASVTTVSRRIADLYEKQFAFQSGIVENALPPQGVVAGDVSSPIELVHSGAALPNRHIEEMMRAAAQTRTPVRMHLYLTGQGTEYYRSLLELADQLGPRVTIHEPVLPQELIATLSQYDVGVHLLPPVPTNNSLALPNKFFDFVQARLGVLVGPTEDMANRVREFGIGAVAEDYTAAALTAVLDDLTVEDVERWKEATGPASEALDVTPMLQNWKLPIDAISGGNDNRGTRQPRVTVVVPVHDPSRPIHRAVSSVVSGTSTSLEVLVVAHNVSPQEIVAALRELQKDARVRVLSLQDGIRGPASPKNFGLENATGRFVSFLDSDDVFEAGAIDRWVSLADAEPWDVVIANRTEPDGSWSASPPVRVGRRRNLKGVADRLAYRAAPFGLLRRSLVENLRFPEDVPTGEDLAFSSQIWFSQARIAFAFGAPGYRVFSDQDERATTIGRPLASDMAWLDATFNPQLPWMRDREARRSMVIKALRENIPDTVADRLPERWSSSDAVQMGRMVSRLVDCENSSLGFLSVREHRFVEALLDEEASGKRLSQLLKERSQLRTLGSLTPQNPLLVFASAAPLRYRLAGRALRMAQQRAMRTEDRRRKRQ